MYQLWPCLLIEIADGYYGLGTGYMNVYDYENATRYLNIAQTMFNAIGSAAKYSRCLRVLRECHERCGRRDRAALCTDKINELEGIMVMIMMVMVMIMMMMMMIMMRMRIMVVMIMMGILVVMMMMIIMRILMMLMMVLMMMMIVVAVVVMIVVSP